MLEFPHNRKIKGTEWGKIARDCLPDYAVLPLERLTLDFLNYLLWIRYSHIHSTKTQSHFEFYCKYVASRNWD